MRCKCCNSEMGYSTRKVAIPRPNVKGHIEFIYVEEDLCRKCISISENFSNGYTEDEEFDVASLGVDIPQYTNFDEY